MFIVETIEDDYHGTSYLYKQYFEEYEDLIAHFSSPDEIKDDALEGVYSLIVSSLGTSNHKTVQIYSSIPVRYCEKRGCNCLAVSETKFF